MQSELICQESPGQFIVSIDAPVTEKRPAMPLPCNCREVEFCYQHTLFVDRRFTNKAAVGCRNKTLAPEFDTASTGWIGLEADAIDCSYKTAIGDRV